MCTRFQTDVQKEGGGKYKIDLGLGLTESQPTGIWGSYVSEVSTGDILKRAWASDFPIGASPGLPDWLERAVDNLSGGLRRGYSRKDG